MLSLEEKYEYFKNTIFKCGSYLRTKDDETIEYNLFEEFSVDVVSFLHKKNLKLFLEEGMIDRTILEKSMELRKRYLKLEENKDLFHIDCVKKTEEWKKVLELSDEVKDMLYW